MMQYFTKLRMLPPSKGNDLQTEAATSSIMSRQYGLKAISKIDRDSLILWEGLKGFIRMTFPSFCSLSKGY